MKKHCTQKNPCKECRKRSMLNAAEIMIRSGNAHLINWEYLLKEAFNIDSKKLIKNDLA